jgi:hypothetical protein
MRLDSAAGIREAVRVPGEGSWSTIEDE